MANVRGEDSGLEKNRMNLKTMPNKAQMQTMMRRMLQRQQSPAFYRRVGGLVKTNVFVVVTQGTVAASAHSKTDPRMSGQCAKEQPKCATRLALMSTTTMVKMT